MKDSTAKRKKFIIFFYEFQFLFGFISLAAQLTLLNNLHLQLKDKYNYFLLLLHYSTTVPPISRELSMKKLRRN